MRTQLADFIRDTPAGREADAILRNCVHCGFCSATCPTYQLLGDELDGPRGRIYLIKQVLEGSQATAKTQLHLDRCLTCRSCETTCPSGVQYGRLLDIGRHAVHTQVGRGMLSAIVRGLLRAIIPHRARFAALLRLGQSLAALPGEGGVVFTDRDHAGVHHLEVVGAAPGTREAAVQCGDRVVPEETLRGEGVDDESVGDFARGGGAYEHD